MKAMKRNYLGLAVAMLAMACFVGCSNPAQNQAAQNSAAPPASGGASAGGSAATPGYPAGSSAPTRNSAPANSSAQAENAPAQPATIAVPPGTNLHVVLNQTISSETAQAGDTFDASMIEPVVVRGETVIPRDARVQGHVTSARASGRLSGVAEIALTLDSVQVGGRTYNIQTSTVGRRGSSHKKRDIFAIGGGSALGAIIGGIAGGGKGAAIGAAAGAGAGTAGAAATGKKNIALPAEDHLVFRLESRLVIQR